MKVFDYIFKFFSWLGSLIIDGFNFLFSLLMSLFQGIFAVLDFIFYFLTQSILVIFLIIKIFFALFQYLFSVTFMFFKFIASFIVPHFEKYPLVGFESDNGFNVVLQLLRPTGALDVLPFALACLLWFFFVKKVIGLFGGNNNA